MKYAIIAAGEGSRLSKEGAILPKPLTPIGNSVMIERLISIFINNDAEEIVVIVNEENIMTRDFLYDMKDNLDVPLTVLVKSTPSSMHSFYELSKYLENDRFCLTTVDTIFKEEEFAMYIKTFKECSIDGLMGVTTFVDDEKPLYVSTDNDFNITGFHDSFTEDCHFVSGGIYCLSPSAIKVLDECIKNGVERMRNFQRALVKERLTLKAWPFKKIIDVDHATDIIKAEEFLAEK